MTYAFSHSHPLIGSQWRSFVWDDSVRATLEGARTFGFLSEVDALRRRGLALGGSLENAVVFHESGVCNPEGLRFPDECVRHKILDFLGDLMLLGRPLVAHVVAFRGGHTAHLQLVERLRRGDS
jgi:UDP-3-O-[3-hydroxymyristoyl] N-acetylglucosamine deacetylase